MDAKAQKTEIGGVLPKVKRAACYDRVSTPQQQESGSINSQVSITQEYCHKMGYEVTKHYKDDGWSGALSLRPDAEQLIADAEAGLFDVVVCTAVDRMSRNPEFYWRIVPALKRAGIKVEYVQTPINGENDVLMENVLVGVAADERQRIARRFANGKREKIVVRKQLVVHKAPYGFKYLRDKNDPHDPGHLEHKLPEKQITQTIFQWIGHENVSSKETIRRLAEMKIPSPRGFPVWRQSTLLSMVKNEVYLGRFFYYRNESIVPKKYRQEIKFRKNPKTGHRLRPRDQWALVELPELRIIDDKTFELVRQALLRNRMFSKRNTKRQVLLGGGLIVCESCSCTYYAGSIHGRDIYKCGNKLRRFPLPPTCTAERKAISAGKIETAVWNLISKILKDPDFLIEQLEKNRDLFQKERVDTLRDIELVESQIADKETEERRLVMAVQKGILRDIQIQNPFKQLNFEKAFLIGRRNSLKAKLNDVELGNEAQNDIRLFCAQVGDSIDNLTFEDKREVVRLVVKRIYCNGERIRIQGRLPIHSDKEPEIPLNVIKPYLNMTFGKIENNKLP